MKVKRYVVDSMPEALQKIRSDLGNDAVILNTKEIRSGGFLGMFGKKKIEVIAATDAESPATVPERRIPAASLMTANPSTGSTAAAAAYRNTGGTERKATAPIRTSGEMPYVPDVLPAETAAAVEQIPGRSSRREQLSQSEQNENETMQVPSPSNTRGAKEDLLLEEIRQMKTMVRKLSEGDRGAGAHRHPVVASMMERLKDRELLPALADTVAERLEEEAAETGAELDEDWVLEATRRQLYRLFDGQTEKEISPDTRVIHFVGPTGVGKTTTIAKLAAEQVLMHRRKVGFITSDTYRIAAVEQLRTYATILNVPLEVVFSPQDLAKAFSKLESCDLIFMDTAGRNFRNEMYVSELNAFLQSEGKSETFLVLSLANKYKDMKVITENFMTYKLDKVLFTKMDETESYGAIVNLITEYPLRLSYITNGQNVPDDIFPIQEHEIVNLLTEEKSDG